jgi:hypothetical protein
VILQHFGLGIARDHYAPVETHKKQSGWQGKMINIYL